MVAEDSRVVIFESAHDGYGDAQHDELAYIFPRRNRRPYSYNRVFGTLDTRWHGEIAVGHAYAEVTNFPSSTSGPAIFAKQWENTVPNPILIAVYPITRNTDGLVVTIAGGVAATAAAFGALPMGAALHSSGVTAAAAPALYIGFGGLAAATKVKYRNRAGTTAATTNLYADKLLSLNGDLYLTFTPTGTGAKNCAVGKISAGTDPISAAQPSATIVGFVGENINNLVPDGTGMYPVALTPSGIFTYDRALDIWRNRVSSWVVHPDNGKAYWYEDGDLCVALGQGGAVRFNGTDVLPYDPIPLYGLPDHDTTGQLISAAGNTRHWGALVTKIGSKHQRAGGTGDSVASVSVGVTTDGATYTDYTSAASDGDPATSVTLSALSTIGALDWIIVGHAQPFVGIWFESLAANAVTGALLTVEIWNGSAWVAVSATDLTTDNAAAAPFSRTGWLMMTVDPVALGWVLGTFTVGTSKSRYWARVGYASGGPLTTPTTLKTIDLLPYRPSLSTDFSLDGLDRAGAYPHLLFSRTSADGEHVTHDYGNMGSRVDEIGAVVYGDGGGAGGGDGNDARGLYFFGMRSIRMLHLSLDDRPAQTSWPMLSGGSSLIEFATIDLGQDSRIEDFKIECLEWRATGYLYYRFEDGRPWTKAGEFSNVPVTLPGDLSGVGRYLKVALGLNLSTAGTGIQFRQASRPRLIRIDCQPRPSAQTRGRLPVQTPPIC